MSRARTGAGVVAILLAVTVGCGGQSGISAEPAEDAAGAPVVLRAATLKPGQAVPAPKGKPVLTITGKVSAFNGKDAIGLDRATLDRLGLVRVRVYEPWVKKDVEFRGVWLQDLLEVAGAAADASTLRITALDDYQVTLTSADVRGREILLATYQGDGTQIPVDKGGPTRIIFLDGVRAGANADQWIWSLKAIEVR
jgi:hypothetical protein